MLKILLVLYVLGTLTILYVAKEYLGKTPSGLLQLLVFCVTWPFALAYNYVMKIFCPAQYYKMTKDNMAKLMKDMKDKEEKHD